MPKSLQLPILEIFFFLPELTKDPSEMLITPQFFNSKSRQNSDMYVCIKHTCGNLLCYWHENWLKWVIEKCNLQSGILILKLYFINTHQESNQFSCEAKLIILQKFYNAFMLQHGVLSLLCVMGDIYSIHTFSFQCLIHWITKEISSGSTSHRVIVNHWVTFRCLSQPPLKHASESDEQIPFLYVFSSLMCLNVSRVSFPVI